MLPVLVAINFSFSNAQLVDKKATKKTKALYKNLKMLAGKGVMFGHEDDQAYGIDWKAEKGRSDVKDLVGDYPAIHGWDVGGIGRNPYNLDSVNFEDMLKWIKQAYKRGGINTISWHMENLASDGSSWEKTPVVKDMLVGGKYHQTYKKNLDALAGFLRKCKVGFTPIPIIFRPFHEHNGSWFWWAKGFCTEDEYKALWRFTVTYLVEEQQVHNLIFAYSPDRSRMEVSNSREEYFYGYPGDDYVDVLGLDNYWDVGRSNNEKPIEGQRKDFVESLQLVVGLAKEKGKVAALTETGLDKLTHQNWFTQFILNPLKTSPEASQISYFLVWRNAHKGHHYVPYQGHHCVEDFKAFKQDSLTLFEADLPKMYKKNRDGGIK